VTRPSRSGSSGRAWLGPLPAAVVRFRWAIVAAWCVIAVLVIPISRNIENRLEVAARMPLREASAVRAELEERFRSPFTDRVLLVAQGIPEARTREGRAALEAIVGGIRNLPGVAGTLSALDTNNPLFVGNDGGTLVIVGLESGSEPVESLLPALREKTAEILRELKSKYPSAWLGWTGEAPLNADLRIASASDARLAEARVLPLSLLLLLFAFGTVVASILPVAIGVLAIAFSIGVAAFLAQYFTISILIQTLASMIGLGLGIDYALLMVSRFREALSSGMSTAAAAEEAARRAGWTIFLSAFPVSISFGALLMVPLSEQRSIGVAGLLVTLFAWALSVTLLPAVLSLLGRNVDRLRVRPDKPGRAAEGSKGWREWGRHVTSRPVLYLVVASAPLLLLAFQGRRLDTTMPRGDWLPRGTEAVEGYHRLKAMGRANLVHGLRVVLDLPAGVTIESEPGWAAATRLYDKLANDSRVERVECVVSLVRGRDPKYLALVPPGVRSSLAAADGSAALFEVIPSTRLAPAEQVALAREVRTWNAATVTGLAGTAMRVGGQPAFDADYEDVVSEHFRLVIALVVGCTFIALFAGFRSLMIAIKAVLLNLLSVGAAFGALVLVFQEGWGSRLLGLGEATGSVFPIIPVIVFCIVFGLSMDYEVILVARVAEARRAGFDESPAIAEGLARSATVITNAAAIMIVVFAGFTLGEFLPIKMLGFALSVAVLVDAIAVRMVIGPALLRLAGRWNWWPGGLR
jgi:RND superfamily putative drug exporter